MAQKSVREVVSPTDLVVIVGLLKRVFGVRTDIGKFLHRIDEPDELDALYAAIEVLVGEVEDVPLEPVNKKVAK